MFDSSLVILISCSYEVCVTYVCLIEQSLELFADFIAKYFGFSAFRFSRSLDLDLK